MQERTDDEVNRIGAAAGIVWQTLSTAGALTIPKLIEASGLSRDLVVFGLGWLAREGKLQFLQRGRTRLVELTDGEMQQTEAA